MYQSTIQVSCEPFLLLSFLLLMFCQKEISVVKSTGTDPIPDRSISINKSLDIAITKKHLWFSASVVHSASEFGFSQLSYEEKFQGLKKIVLLLIRHLAIQQPLDTPLPTCSSCAWANTYLLVPQPKIQASLWAAASSGLSGITTGQRGLNTADIFTRQSLKQKCSNNDSGRMRE